MTLYGGGGYLLTRIIKCAIEDFADTSVIADVKVS